MWAAWVLEGYEWGKLGAGLTSEVLSFAILEEAHPFVESRHLKRLFSLRWAVARDVWPIFQGQDLWNMIRDSLPDSVDHVRVIPNDATAVASVFDRRLSSTSNVDRCFPPYTACILFGHFDEGLAFGFCEAIF